MVKHHSFNGWDLFSLRSIEIFSRCVRLRSFLVALEESVPIPSHTFDTLQHLLVEREKNASKTKVLSLLTTLQIKTLKLSNNKYKQLPQLYNNNHVLQIHFDCCIGSFIGCCSTANRCRSPWCPKRGPTRTKLEGRKGRKGEQ